MSDGSKSRQIRGNYRKFKYSIEGDAPIFKYLKAVKK